jgi:hypothetical protein
MWKSKILSGPYHSIEKHLNLHLLFPEIFGFIIEVSTPFFFEEYGYRTQVAESQRCCLRPTVTHVRLLRFVIRDS